MKKNRLTILFLLTMGFVAGQESQDPSSLSKSLGLYVFPNNDQSTEVQSNDESACYKWAREQTGYDPINPTQVTPEQAQTGPDGSAIVGGAKGAAAGAAIGAIAGDAGKGAAIGAVVGGLAGRRSRMAHEQMEQQQNDQAAAAQEQQMLDNFKKAFSACMEGKGYTVK